MSINDYENLIRIEVFNTLYKSFNSSIDLAKFITSLPLGTIMSLPQFTNEWLENNDVIGIPNGYYKEGDIVKIPTENHGVAYYKVYANGYKDSFYLSGINEWIFEYPTDVAIWDSSENRFYQQLEFGVDNNSNLSSVRFYLIKVVNSYSHTLYNPATDDINVIID